MNDLRESLEGVQYSSRFCLGLFYSPATASQITLPEGAGAMYLNDPESPFCFVAVDNVRRGIKTGAFLVSHDDQLYILDFSALKDTKEKALLRVFTSLSPIDKTCCFFSRMRSYIISALDPDLKKRFPSVSSSIVCSSLTKIESYPTVLKFA